MKNITPFLWYDTQAEEAANLYVSVFNGAPESSGTSRITKIARYTGSGAEASGRPAGSVMTVAFELEGQQWTAINGGPVFTFNESISFVVSCDSQDEIDYFWNALIDTSRGEGQCGWLKDTFGLSWQIVPSMLDELMTDDPAVAERVMAKILTMKKIEIDELREA